MPLTSFTYWNYAAPSGGVPGRVQVNIGSIGSGGLNNIYTSYHNGPTFSYKSNKTYQIVTNVVNLYQTTASFSVSPSWNDELFYYNGASASKNYSIYPGVNKTQSYIHYSSPTSNVTTTRDVIYKANGTFSASKGITDFKINELEFKLQGFSYYKITGSELDPLDYNSLGWYYHEPTSVYHWYDKITGSSSLLSYFSGTNDYYPINGDNSISVQKVPNIGNRLNNALVKFVPYSYFNLSFNYQNSGDFPLKIYTSNQKPLSIPAPPSDLLSGIYTPPTGSLLIATITQSFAVISGVTYSSHNVGIPVQFYGLRGNQYLWFVGPYAGASASGTTYSSVYLSNIKVEGGYHPGNNRRYVMYNYSTHSVPLNLIGATYTAFSGSGNTINATSSLSYSQVFSKIGNGKFKAGIWENGVWNSGWRVDEDMYEFYNINQYFSYNKTKRWRFQLNGPITSVDKFNIGDNVSIGNIVAIDINEDRKLLKGYYTIINKIGSSIVVEFDNDFPLRRIQKDSDNHKIFVTKNVWLSGGFLNGYFTGIWNYGLFKGYPLITEMYDSQWIDGVFDGGHFSSSLYKVPDFTDTVFQSGSLGLTFSQPHGLLVGDLITIDKNDKTINDQYDGDHTVTDVVNEYQIIVDVDWGYDTILEGGKVSIDKSTGIVQRMDFKSNNKSKITSVQSSPTTESVFIYNSWMDLVYSDQSAVNIQKPQTLINKISNKSYSENNLYGYPTNDVLESSSTFRDSFSTNIKKYRLGTKYKIFADYIGDAGNFEEYFTETSTNKNEFISKGWTFSTYTASNIEFSRTEDSGIYPLIGEELRIKATKGGGILDITPFSDEEILNKTYAAIEKNRYTKIEFDLITFSNTGDYGAYFDSSDENIYNEIAIPAFFEPDGSDMSGGTVNLTDYYYYWLYGALTPFYNLAPSLHFNNLNLMKRDVYYPSTGNGGTFGTASTYVPALFLPINKNVNHLNTKKIKKKEYFFNKRNLSMVLHGYFSNNQLLTTEYIIDNLHFYEVDMIPFFQYFTDVNINKSIQIPYQGISPFIDYTNSNFNFIDNISIGLDSIQTQNSNTVVSGVGLGVGASTNNQFNTFALAMDFNFTIAEFTPSDSRLKTNINKISVSNSGINIYTFEFIDKPNEVYQGIIAQELIGTKFESATKIESDGYYHVDYSKLDVEFKKIN